MTHLRSARVKLIAAPVFFAQALLLALLRQIWGETALRCQPIFPFKRYLFSPWPPSVFPPLAPFPTTSRPRSACARVRAFLECSLHSSA